MISRYSFLLVCFILTINCNDTTKKNDKIEKMDKRTLYFDLADNPVHISDYRGKKILLNYWATWCTPCLKEMPSMERAFNKLTNENFVFLFATTDDLEKIIQFKEHKNYPFTYLQYKGSLDKLKIYALPSTMVYDSKGSLANRFDGAREWDSKEMLDILKSIP